ncbi:MAG: PadR family transcriptional regulator [Anaerotignum sp.]
MVSSEVIRGYTDTMILFILLQEDSYGYAISRRIRELSQEEYSMKETTLYSAFNRLEKNGAIKSYPGEVTHGKPRTYFKITEAGRKLYKEKCREWYNVQGIVSNFILEGFEDGDN